MTQGSKSNSLKLQEISLEPYRAEIMSSDISDSQSPSEEEDSLETQLQPLSSMVSPSLTLTTLSSSTPRPSPLIVWSFRSELGTSPQSPWLELVSLLPNQLSLGQVQSKVLERLLAILGLQEDPVNPSLALIFNFLPNNMLQFSSVV